MASKKYIRWHCVLCIVSNEHEKLPWQWFTVVLSPACAQDVCDALGTIATRAGATAQLAKREEAPLIRLPACVCLRGRAWRARAHVLRACSFAWGNQGRAAQAAGGTWAAHGAARRTTRTDGRSLWEGHARATPAHNTRTHAQSTLAQPFHCLLNHRTSPHGATSNNDSTSPSMTR